MSNLAKTWLLSIPITFIIALITWDWPVVGGVAQGTGYAALGFVIAACMVLFWETLR